jgi:hypothetical protein
MYSQAHIELSGSGTGLRQNYGSVNDQLCSLGAFSQPHGECCEITNHEHFVISTTIFLIAVFSFCLIARSFLLMFRALSTTSGSSLLRCPSTLGCIRQPYRVVSSKAKSPTIVQKSPRKSLKSSSNIIAGLGTKDSETKSTKKGRTTRKIQTGSGVDSIATETADKDREDSAAKDKKEKKRRASRRVSIDIDDLGPNIREEHAVQKYLNAVYKAKRRAIRSRIFDPKRVHIVSKSLCGKNTLLTYIVQLLTRCR